MVINFSNIDYNERPILILKNAGGTPLGVLGYANLITPNISYNETSVLEFSIPACVDGNDVPFYDDVVGLRIVELMGIGQFTLVNPIETGDGVMRTKQCKGYSLEYEFARKKITIEAGTFKFWDTVTIENTLLGRIMELMPSWQVGDVSKSLFTRYRTFEAKNDNVYNFIKSSVQQSYGCIFIFDTLNRLVHVRDADEVPANTAIFLSHENLAKEIVLEENTEDVFTRLDVSGAEGVNIRDVNPAGTNQLINLDYYMTPANFSQTIIDKYFSWKKLFEDNKRSYYLLSVQYSLKLSQRISEQAKLTDLEGELKNLENLQAVAIQAIAQGLGAQGDLDKANADIATKKEEIAAQQAVIDGIQDDTDALFKQIKTIRDACNFETYFTKEEYIQLDRYINDTEVSDPSFAVKTTSTYTESPEGSQVNAMPISMVGSSITSVEDVAGATILDITGGRISIGDQIDATIVSAVVEIRNGEDIVASVYTGEGTHSGTSYPSGCVTMTGKTTDLKADSETDFNCTLSGYVYFTLDATEYEKRSIAWELFEYGDGLLKKISTPGYTFKITSANFFSIAEFEAFKNALRLGERIYIRISKDRILTPILIGVKFEYDQPDSIELTFSDSFASGDSVFRLVDLLEQSVSMGKNLDVSKYIYSAFTDSGADTGIKNFMNSALDVSKNAIMSSTDQAVSWDGAGIRLRKYSNEAKTAFEDEQIWMNNNSILMTDDGWNTAKMAIGKFHDENLGDCWGIVADRIVGTLIAGSSMMIESEKKDGGTAVFRMDSDGCRLYNSDFSLMNGTTQIALNPDIGIAIGQFPIYKEEMRAVSRVLNEENCRFWVDADGNVHIKGTLHGVDGEFTGELRCVSMDGTYFRVDHDTMGFFDKDGNPLLHYEDGSLTMTGGLNATSLNIVTSSGNQTLDVYIGNNPDLVAAVTATSELGGRLTTVESKVTPTEIVNTVTSSSKYQEDMAATNGQISDLAGRVSTAEQKITDSAIIQLVTESETFQTALDEKVSNEEWQDTNKGYDEDLRDLVSRVSTAESKIESDAIVNTVTMSETFKNTLNGFTTDEEFEKLSYRVTTAEQSILPDSIITTVTQSDGYKLLQTTVTQTAEGLSSKVDKNGIISSINQSAETVEIDAEKIKLEGTVTANGNFKVLTDGSVEAVNGKFSGSFTAGNWTFDSNGATYRPYSGSSNYLRIYSDGNYAYYDTRGMPARYGANASYPTNIYGNFIRFTPASADCGIVICNSASTYNEELGRIEYEDPSIICDGASNGDANNDWYPTSCGNIGTRYKRWDIGWIRYLNLGDSPHVLSARNSKHNINPLDSMGDAIDRLTPVSFIYNWEKTDKLSYGLILEDTIDVLPVICDPGDDHGFEGSIRYEMLIPVLLREIQDLRKRVAALEA